MKPAYILGAIAAVVTAAPVEERQNNNFNANDLNNLAFNSFNSLDLQYLGLINSLDFQVLAQLESVNNFNVLQFSNLFNSQQFNVQSLLDFQMLAMLIQLTQVGAFNGLDLNGLLFNQLNFGLINNDVFNFDFSNVIEQALIPQITTIVQQGVVVKE